LAQINALVIRSATVDKQLVFLKLGDSSEDPSGVAGMVAKPAHLEKPKKLRYK